ncbi:MAG: hypothetical protein ABJC26_02080 [Gemmatimonadaceae bacterium]
MKLLPRTALVLVAAVAALTLPSLSTAQGVTVQSVSNVHFQGAFGGVMAAVANLGGGGAKDSTSTMYLSGHKMRTDHAGTGSIIDLDGERIITIDDKAKTYSTMTFAEMMAAMQQAQQSAEKSKAQQQSKQSGKPTQTSSNDSVHVNYKVAVDRTGQHERVAGYDAERVFITITLEAEAKSDKGNTEQAGSMVFLMNQLISNSAPQIAAMSDFNRAYAQKMGAAFHEQAAGLQAAFNSDPRIKNGLEAAAKELQKVPGISLRSTTYIVVVPPNVPFDRQLALNDAASAAKADNAKKDEKPKGGFGGLLGSLKAAAEQSNKQSADKDKEPAKQSTLMSVTNEVKSITPGAVASDMFAPPVGYREVKKTR